jgi:hypothetical protein
MMFFTKTGELTEKLLSMGVAQDSSVLRTLVVRFTIFTLARAASSLPFSSLASVYRRLCFPFIILPAGQISTMNE